MRTALPSIVVFSVMSVVAAGCDHEGSGTPAASGAAPAASASAASAASSAPAASGAPAASPASAAPAASAAPPADTAPKLVAPTVPDNLKTGDAEVLTAKLSATGTQNYECLPGDKGAFAWKLVAPEADLTDETGKKVAHHYAGPTWEATDGSKVVGEKKAQADAPGGQAIPWLLLKAKSATGTGVFGKVTSVQRLETEAGLAPSTGCDAKHKGAKQNVPYKATYYFYSAR